MTEFDDSVVAFIEAACVPLDSSHASGVLKQAQAILASQPDVAGHRNDTDGVRFITKEAPSITIDSISSHHNSFHDKRRGVEVEEQADAEARCAEIGPHRCEVHVLQGFDGF